MSAMNYGAPVPGIGQIVSIQEFHMNFLQLSHHPDRSLIERLTTFAQRYLQSSRDVVHIICTRLGEASLPENYKLPIFYLLDSIMKHKREYVPLFSSYLESMYSYIFTNLPERDRSKLDFLMKTWEERMLLSSQLLMNMRNSLRPPVVVAPVVPQYQYTSSYQAPAHYQPPAPPQQSFNQPPEQWNSEVVQPSYYDESQQQQSYPTPPAEPSSYYQAPPPPPQPIPAPVSVPVATRPIEDPRVARYGKRQRVSPVDSLNAALKTEMMNILGQLLSGLGPDQAVTLEELHDQQNDLFQQIKLQAESVLQLQQNTFDETNYPAVPLSVDNSGGHDIANNDSFNPQLGSDGDMIQPPIPHSSFIGFINECPVTIQVDRMGYLRHQLIQSNKLSSLSAEALASCRKLTTKLSYYEERVNSNRRLPDMLFGTLPLTPTNEFLKSVHNVRHIEHVIAKKPIPPFRVEDLNLRPTIALKGLYIDRKFLAEDGQRFTTLEAKSKHNDKLIAERIEQRKQLQRGDTSSTERKCRPWFHSLSQWIGRSPSNNHDGDKDNKAASSSSGSGGNAAANTGTSNKELVEEYVVLADEFFIRCPISRETFEKFWDSDENELMYRHAVKVLIPSTADASKYSLGKPTEANNLRYMIVKSFVLDTWIASGAVTKLNDAIIRYQAMGKDEELIDSLRNCIQDDDDGDDVFVYII